MGIHGEGNNNLVHQLLTLVVIGISTYHQQVFCWYCGLQRPNRNTPIWGREPATPTSRIRRSGFYPYTPLKRWCAPTYRCYAVTVQPTGKRPPALSMTSWCEKRLVNVTVTVTVSFYWIYFINSHINVNLSPTLLIPSNSLNISLQVRKDVPTQF